ncbi:hypothetical protein CHISP_1414 [Chitinispirillum alkaliphilum]|nr:hypothetical protein CHISP_1414 [Chitinispirillum alkaliphilum]
MKIKISIAIIVVCFCTLFTFSVIAEETDRVLTSQLTSSSLISRSLGGAGTAMPRGVMQGLINPALVYSYRSHLSERGVIALGYDQDSLYEKIQLPLGMGFATNEGAIGLFYRMNRGEAGQIYEFTTNLSGRLSEQVDAQGPVEYGLNFKYQRMSWNEEMFTPPHNTSGNQLSETNNFIDNDGRFILESENHLRRLTMDLGFFQSNVTPNLDFSLVFRNLLGYEWKRTDASYLEFSDTGMVNDSMSVDITGESVQEDKKSRGWIESRQRTLVTGVAYKLNLMQGVEVTVPFDVEILGLFDRNTDIVYIFRGGLQGRLFSNYFVRFGFARAPEKISELTSSLKMDNLFFGGAGLYIDPMYFDFYMGQDEWGVTASFEF